MRSHLKRLSLFLLCTVTLLFAVDSDVSGSSFEEAIVIEVIPEAITPEQCAVVKVIASGDVCLSFAAIEASALGLKKEIPFDLPKRDDVEDPLIFSQTVSLCREVEPGRKELALRLVDENGVERKILFEIEALPDGTSEEGDADSEKNAPFVCRPWDQSVIYFLLTDRFADGDPSNNDPNGEQYDTSQPETYHGGDFQGIIDNLDYLESLGVNLIWITPIVDNIDWNVRSGKDGPQYGYHGYWAKNFSEIDEHLGDIETFHRLIDEAASRGIGIIVDVVLNHAGYGMKVTDRAEHIKNYPTKEEQQVFSGMLRLDPPPHMITGELFGLPDFITEDREVREQLIAWQTAWIEKSRTEKGNQIAGFRVDTVRHVDLETWRQLKVAVTMLDPSFKLLGESFGASPGQDWGALQGGGMDALLDFGFKTIAQDYIRGEIERAERQLVKRGEKIDNTQLMAQFLGSHDEDGFLLTRAKNDVGLFKVAAALQMTAKGIPVIYSGEEIGMSGRAAGDMDKGEFSENRADFCWEDIKDHELPDHYRRLISMRNRQADVFARGERVTLFADDDAGVSVFERRYGSKAALVALNTNNTPVLLKLSTALSPDMVLYEEYTQTKLTVGIDSILELSVPGKDEGGVAAVFIGAEQVSEVMLWQNSSID